MSIDLLARAESLRTDRVPFVLATVVRAERPTSAHPGDRAIVLADGSIEGFVGGACAVTTLRTQAAALLSAPEAGSATLLRITPASEPVPGATPAGTVVVDNPCLSGGTLEIFLEAVLPSTLVHVFGDTPIARALVAVGAAAGYDVVAVTDLRRSRADPEPQPEAAIPPGVAAVVVASHGQDELPVLRAALAEEVPYLALVASRKRGEAVLAELGESAAGRVKTPAGLDIGARTPGEIAVSICAELVSCHPSAPAPPLPAMATDPVCGMTVTALETAPSYVYAGRTWYFCSSGCRDAFAGSPDAYAV
jgi:xanthine dehydrogenase accessory factor